MTDANNRNVVIMGCGPAGLASGYDLAKCGVDVVCLEKDNIVGGISRLLTCSVLKGPKATRKNPVCLSRPPLLLLLLGFFPSANVQRPS
jgi:monoamine oxidase